MTLKSKITLSVLTIFVAFAAFASQASAYSDKDRREIKAVAIAGARADLRHDWATSCRLSTPYSQARLITQASRAYHRHFTSCKSVFAFGWTRIGSKVRAEVVRDAQEALQYVPSGQVSFKRSEFEHPGQMAAQLIYNGGTYQYFSLINGHWRHGLQPHGVFTG